MEIIRLKNYHDDLLKYNFIKCRINHKPIPWQTPRINFKIKRFYDPQKSVKKTYRLALEILEKKDMEPNKKDFGYYVHFKYFMGKPHPTKKYYNEKPDSSNMTKFLEDVFKGILWEDDSKIVCSVVDQFYSKPPGHTEIQVVRFCC